MAAHNNNRKAQTHSGHAHPQTPPLPAYHVVLREALEGDPSLFVSGTELDASWALWTPTLHGGESAADSPKTKSRSFTYTTGSDPSSAGAGSRAGRDGEL